MLDHISDFFIDKSITNNEVKRYLEESYAIKLICLDKNDIKLASVCHKLAIIYHKNNQLDESLSLLKQSISIYEIQQSDPAQIVKLRILYANILIKQSKFQEAKDVLIHSVEEI
jgi:tetratricopeptide (TPR) repeat protein